MKKTWCKHIKYWGRPASIVWGDEFPAQHGWSYIHGYGIIQVDKWMFCPICGAKRPNK